MMEIWQFLFGNRLRTVALLGLPILAFGLAAGWTLQSPSTTESKVQITLPQLPDEPLADWAINPYADHVAAAIHSPQVVALTDGSIDMATVTVDHSAGSRIVEVTMDGGDADSRDSLTTLARNALALVLERDVVVATQRANTTESFYRDVRGQLDGIIAEAGVVDVDDNYDRYVDEIVEERANIQANEASGDQEAVVEASNRMRVYEEEVARLAPLLPEYGTLRDELDNAGVLRVGAQESLQDVIALAAAVDDPSFVEQMPVVSVSRRQEALINGVSALVVVAVLVTFLFLLLRARSSWARPQRSSDFGYDHPPVAERLRAEQEILGPREEAGRHR